MSGCRYERTIRTQECDLLCRPCSAGEKRVRCQRCSRFRAHLRVKRSRHNNSDPSSSSTADNNHTSYNHLSKDELVERLKNVQKSRKIIRRKYRRLAKKVIKKEGVKISEADESDIRMLIDDVTPEIRTNYGKDSPQYVLWQEQKKYVQLTSEQASDALAPTCYSICTKSLLFLQSSLSKCYKLWLSGSTFRTNTEGLHPLVFCSQWCAVRVY